MSDVQPSKLEFNRLLGLVGDLATQIQRLQDQQRPGHEVRVYTVPVAVVEQPAPPQPVPDAAAATSEDELPRQDLCDPVHCKPAYQENARRLNKLIYNMYFLQWQEAL